MKKVGITKFDTPLDELEVMAGFKDSPQWEVMRRWVKRYIENCKNTSYKLLEHDPRFPFRHAELAGQGLALVTFVKFVENIGKEIEKLEKDGSK
jgi:hypothetical protein